MKKTLATTLLLTIFLSACGSEPEKKMSDAEAQKFFATLEDARNQARQNAEINARMYRAESPRLENTRLVTHGDSTQSADCPQGQHACKLYACSSGKPYTTRKEYRWGAPRVQFAAVLVNAQADARYQWQARLRLIVKSCEGKLCSAHTKTIIGESNEESILYRRRIHCKRRRSTGVL